MKRVRWWDRLIATLFGKIAIVNDFKDRAKINIRPLSGPWIVYVKRVKIKNKIDEITLGKVVYCADWGDEMDMYYYNDGTTSLSSIIWYSNTERFTKEDARKHAKDNVKEEIKSLYDL